jgi:hypothetical protein
MTASLTTDLRRNLPDDAHIGMIASFLVINRRPQSTTYGPICAPAPGKIERAYRRVAR